MSYFFFIIIFVCLILIGIIDAYKKEREKKKSKNELIEKLWMDGDITDEVYKKYINN